MENPKVRKRFTAIKIGVRKVDETKEVVLTYGYDGYLRQTIDETFDTEEEAILEAFKNDPYGDWLIVPKISFINF